MRSGGGRREWHRRRVPLGSRAVPRRSADPCSSAEALGRLVHNPLVGSCSSIQERLSPNARLCWLRKVGALLSPRSDIQGRFRSREVIARDGPIAGRDSVGTDLRFSAPRQLPSLHYPRERGSLRSADGAQRFREVLFRADTIRA